MDKVELPKELKEVDEKAVQILELLDGCHLSFIKEVLKSVQYKVNLVPIKVVRQEKADLGVNYKV
jgi:hypothetical protein